MKKKMRPVMKKRWGWIQYAIAYRKALEKSRIFDLYFVDTPLQRELRNRPLQRAYFEEFGRFNV